ncbi:vigilin [Nephila pilipes]|uniref:Vigilin n=1 Tax=Nephila pilipes TaxID=299642 RepID=A0A8X6MU01_NEPPI|nr:vigilin [Nephila pilipes]
MDQTFRRLEMKLKTKIDLPTEGTESDVIAIREPKEDVMKATKRFLEISNEKQILGLTISIKANTEQHEFLIGKNRASIKNVFGRTRGRSVFPNENDDKNSIAIIGRTGEIETAS